MGKLDGYQLLLNLFKNVHVGDTITTLENESHEQLPGYRKLNPMVYCGLYPVDNSKYKKFTRSIGKNTT